MVLVSINVCCYEVKRLVWANYQLHKLINYTNKKGIKTELLICSELDAKEFEQFPKHKLYPCKQGELIGNKRNILLKHSKGDYICIVDDDDFQCKYRIKMCLELFEYLPKDVHIITLNRLFCYNIKERRSYYVTCESEGALFFRRKIIDDGRRFGTQQIGEGLELAKGLRMYLENDNLIIIAIQHSSNTSYKNYEANLGDIDDILDEHEKILINELIEE